MRPITLVIWTDLISGNCLYLKGKFNSDSILNFEQIELDQDFQIVNGDKKELLLV